MVTFTAYQKSVLYHFLNVTYPLQYHELPRSVFICTQSVVPLSFPFIELLSVSPKIMLLSEKLSSVLEKCMFNITTFNHIFSVEF